MVTGGAVCVTGGAVCVTVTVETPPSAEAPAGGVALQAPTPAVAATSPIPATIRPKRAAPPDRRSLQRRSAPSGDMRNSLIIVSPC